MQEIQIKLTDMQAIREFVKEVVMLKLAVIFESSPFDRKGLFNAVHERIRHLLDTEECTIDAYCIHSWDTAFTRRMRHRSRTSRDRIISR